MLFECLRSVSVCNQSRERIYFVANVGNFMAFVLFLLNTEWAEESLVLTVRIKTEEDRVAGQMFVVVSATFWFGLF